jgi:cell division protein FtsI (penicillin-binding protein 3)
VTLVVGLIIAKLIDVQGLHAASYRALSQQETLQTAPVPAVRGEIVSSNGTVLAFTVRTDTVTADPYGQSASALADIARKLAVPLQLSSGTILQLLRHPSSPQWVELKSSVSASAADAIGRLNLPGIALEPTYMRVYPGGDLAASLLGFVSTNPATQLMTGQAGLEQAYNALLAGRSGREMYEIDAASQPIPGTESVIKTAVPASSLRLTIQSDIQWQAERQCALEIRRSGARTCTVVVMQPATGKILALAQYPTFNPAAPASIAATADIAVAHLFAPGSTAKVITAAAAFADAGQTPTTSYYVPDRIFWHGAWYQDAEAHPAMRYTIAGIIAHSLNDGMIQVASHVTPRQQYAMFRAFGIGAPTGLRLPGEASGPVQLPPLPWTGGYSNERYQISFGQAVGVNAVQMASVYATIADGGVRVAPSVVAGRTTPGGRYLPAPSPARRRVLTAAVAGELMRVLEQVPVTYAQAGETWGLIPGYTVAAKTGTAQNLPGSTFGSSFIGIAPASSTGLVVAVNVQDPRIGSRFGIDVAGPVFNAVMRFALATMKIPPDGGHVPYVPLTAP